MAMGGRRLGAAKLQMTKASLQAQSPNSQNVSRLLYGMLGYIGDTGQMEATIFIGLYTECLCI